jgi:hypothetical protein
MTKKQELLSYLESIAKRASEMGVTRSTQQAIDYAVVQLRAEAEPSETRSSVPPRASADQWDEIRSRFKKARELLKDIK